jgi:hypothetical protein
MTISVPSSNTSRIVRSDVFHRVPPFLTSRRMGEDGANHQVRRSSAYQPAFVSADSTTLHAASAACSAATIPIAEYPLRMPSSAFF